MMSHSNLILPLSSLFYRMWRHFLLDDPNTKNVPGVAECSPPPLALRDNDGVCHKNVSWPLRPIACTRLKNAGKLCHVNRSADEDSMAVSCSLSCWRNHRYFDNVKSFFFVRELFFISFTVINCSIQEFCSLIVAVEAKFPSTSLRPIHAVASQKMLFDRVFN